MSESRLSGEQTNRERLGDLLRTNRLAIFLEIVVVLLPLYLGLILGDRSSPDYVPLGGDIALLRAPVTYLGLLISLLLLWGSSRVRGAGWSDYGLAQPKSWLRTVLLGLGVALAILGVVVLLINPLVNALPNVQPRDISHFDFLNDNLPNLIIQLIVIWITAAFLEEFIFRGYLLKRLVDL